MDFENFINKYYGNANKTILANVKFFLNQVENKVVEAKGILGKDATDKELYSSLFEDRDKILELMYSFKKKHKKYDIGMYKYTVFKEFLLHFTEWLNEQDLIENYSTIHRVVMSFNNLSSFLTEDNLSQLYFANVNSVIDFIDDVGEFYLSQVALNRRNFDPYDKASDLLNVKSVAILAWHGFSVSEMLDIDKKDIKALNNCFIIESKPRVYISKLEYNILSAYANTESYRGLPSGRMAHLSEGSKLIRNGSTSQQETGDKFIFNMIKRFNQCAVEMGATNILQPKALSKCGMFSQVYELHRKSNDSVNQIIRRVANCTDYEAYYQSHYYDKWVNIFHPNDK